MTIDDLKPMSYLVTLDHSLSVDKIGNRRSRTCFRDAVVLRCTRVVISSPQFTKGAPVEWKVIHLFNENAMNKHTGNFEREDRKKPEDYTFFLASTALEAYEIFHPQT